MLIASDVIAEAGVGAALNCGIVQREGRVILGGDVIGRFTPIESASFALAVSRLQFREKLTRIAAGLPKQLDEVVCMSCMGRKEFPDIVNACSVEPGPVFEAGVLNVSFDREQSSFEHVSFREIGRRKRIFAGRGDIVSNDERVTWFVFSRDEEREANNDVIYLEYNAMSNERFTTSHPRNDSVWELTQKDVQSWRISCQVNKFSAGSFLFSLMMYRFVQFTTARTGGRKVSEITSEDVLRAVLSSKLSDDELYEKRGRYYEFTECGEYDWRYAIPFIVAIFVILVLRTSSLWEMYDRLEFVHSVPYTSRSWSERALDAQQSRFGSNTAFWKACFNREREIWAQCEDAMRGVPPGGQVGAAVDPRFGSAPMEYEI